MGKFEWLSIRKEQIPRFFRKLLLLLLIAVGYYISVRIGLFFVSPEEKVAVFWPPSGFAIAVYLILPKRMWLDISLAVFITNILGNYLSNNTLLVSAGFGVVNTFEALAASFVILFKQEDDSPLIFRVNGIIRLFTGSFLVIGITSFLGAAVVYLGYGAPYWKTFLQWLLSDSFGVFIITPLFLTIFYNRKYRNNLFTSKVIEPALLTFLILIVSIMVFIIGDMSDWLLQPYILIPLLFFIALRHSFFLVITNLTLSSIIAIWGTVNSMGHYGTNVSSSREALLILQLFLGFKIISTILVSISTYEKMIIKDSLHNAIDIKERLLKEMSHRVKNNLGMISSLLSLQAMNIDDENARSILHDSESRIRSISLVNEKLYKSTSFEKVDFAEYTESLIDGIRKTFDLADSLCIETNCESVSIKVETIIPCGLIINEIITNSIKYAFEGIKNPVIGLRLKKIGSNHAVLTIMDNGIGLPLGFDYKNAQGLGFKLIAELTEQIKGRLKVRSGNGTIISIQIPLQ